MSNETKEEVQGHIAIELMDGARYGGETYVEVVAQMRADAYGGEQSDGVRGYMKQVAKRVWDWSNKRIRIDNSEHFLKDMEKAGLVKFLRSDV